MKRECFMILCTVFLLVVAPAGAVKSTEATLVLSVLLSPECSSSQISVALSKGPYKPAIPITTVTVQQNVMTVRTTQQADRYYVEVDAGACGIRWPAVLLPGTKRHFIVRPVRSRAPGMAVLYDADRALAGKLPALSGASLYLLTTCQPDAYVISHGVVDGDVYDFENFLGRGPRCIALELLNNLTVLIPVDTGDLNAIVRRDLSSEDLLKGQIVRDFTPNNK